MNNNINNTNINNTNINNTNNSIISDTSNNVFNNGIKMETFSNATKFWIDDPYVLLNKNTIFDIWPRENMNREEKVNAISRFVIYATLLGLFMFQNIKIGVTGIVTLMLLIITYYALNNNKKHNLLNKNFLEGFSNVDLYQKFKHNYNNPTTQNPTMNVLLPEIQDNPKRLPAAPAYNKAVEHQINESTKNIIKKNFDNENIDKKLFEDLGDKFQFEQSMRQFYSTANTQVPNNQKEFANFCYGNMASCKDGDVDMCVKSTYRHTNM